VEREANEGGGYPDLHKRGVALCYQIRCAIVHAGTHAVIFDSSPDGTTPFSAHLPELEGRFGFLGNQAV